MEGRRIAAMLIALAAISPPRGASGRSGAAPRPESTLLELLAQPFAPTEGASLECIRDSKIYVAELRKYSPWALQRLLQNMRISAKRNSTTRRHLCDFLQVYDASAKIPPGLITGNIQQLGNYDECLQIKTNQNFAAQACSASVQFEILKGPKKSLELDMKDLLLQVAKASNLKDVPDRSVDYEWMWCVPSTCNYSEISEALELALDPLKVDGRLDFAVTINANSCQTNTVNGNRFDVADWFYVGTMLVFLVIIIASTVYDVHVKRRNKESNRKDTKRNFLLAFSLYSNGMQLLSTERPRGTLTCLDGIRYLSMCWIIYGHTYYLEAVGVKINRIDITKMHENWTSLLVLNGNIVTDTFFLISGILLAYTSLAKARKEENPSVNVFNLYLNRYLRLTPAYAIIIGFYATLFEKLGSGPKWNVWVHNSKLDCRANWWTNILYVNNYVNVSNICMSQSWYLSVDMQLLWISPIFLYPMLKYKKSLFFWVVSGVGIVVSIIIPFLVTYFLRLTGTMLYYKGLQELSDVYLQIYTRVYTRAGPYIIGLCLGYIFFKTKDFKLRIPKLYLLCGWLVAITAGMAAILGPRQMYFNDHAYSKLEASFYAGFHRHVFSLAVSWIIFTCINGYGGPLDALLSWRAWVPLSKLTYSAYLSHYIVLLYNVGSVRSSGNLSGFTSLHVFFGNLCLTMLIALVLCCCFEMPFLALTRQLFSPQPSREAGRLATKGSNEFDYGSEVSGPGLYRSSDNIVESKTSSADSVYTISKSVDSECAIHQDPALNDQRR